MLQPPAIEGAHEGLCGDRHVTVLFHVEVHELRNLRSVGALKGHLCRFAVEELQALTEHRNRVLERERGNLRIDSRDLDRNALDQRVLQRRQVGLQTPLRLLFSQQGLAKEIHVHAQTFLAACLQMRI